MANRVIHFEIPVDNVERCIEFYQKTFGWQFQKWEGGEMPYWLITTGPKDQPGIDGGMLPKRDPRQPLANTIQVEKLDATVKTIEANGGKIVVPKMPIPGVGWLAYFTDPDGNIHGIMEPDAAAR